MRYRIFKSFNLFLSNIKIWQIINSCAIINILWKFNHLLSQFIILIHIGLNHCLYQLFALLNSLWKLILMLFVRIYAICNSCISFIFNSELQLLEILWSFFNLRFNSLWCVQTSILPFMHRFRLVINIT